MNTSVNTLYSEYKGGQALVYCHEALHLQSKLQKAGYEAKTVEWDTDGTRTPTLTRPARRTSSSKGSKRGRAGRNGGGLRHGTFTRSSVRVYSLFWAMMGQMNTLC